ncbi:VanZ family protein [Candidatus Margulisiibacteriota bacterium]
MGKPLNKFLYWLPAILYMALIFYLSSRPAASLVKSMPILLGFKLVHIVEYGFLFYLIRFALLRTTALKSAHLFFVALELTVIYGLTDELHQVFVPFRTGNLLDAFVNGVGAVVVQAGILLRARRRI